MRLPLVRCRGFTLVEILVAVAILSIIGLTLLEITDSIGRTTKQSTSVIDASAQARIAFDRIGLDLKGLVKRTDTDFVGENFASSGANNILLFLSSVTSAAPAAASNRQLSLIAYEVLAHPDNKDAQGTARPCLVRAGKAVAWLGTAATPSTGFMGLQANGLPEKFTNDNFPATLMPSGTQDFDILAPGAIRMVVGFQLYPDNKPVQLLDNYTPTPNFARGQLVYSPPIRTVTGSTGISAPYVDLSRVSALEVGLVIIDLESLRLVSAHQADLLASAFTVPDDASNKTLVQAWSATANNPASLPAGIPVKVSRSLRVYERTYPITPFTTQEP